MADAAETHISQAGQAQYEEGAIAEVAPALQQRRLLTDVHHLMNGMDDSGVVEPTVLADVRTNLETAVCEIAMPYAVTNTVHRVEYQEDEESRRKRRVITWLGKSAVENAANGRLYHFSDAANARVDIEEAEAQDAEQTLMPGRAKVFVSPKMSAADAPRSVAVAEHLADDDSIRVSWVVKNADGEVVGRRLQSLLVSDISLADWYAWLKDPNNLFGRAFEFEHEDSALPVMQLFSELELPEEQLPEGPVTIVAAVLPYIKDTEAREKVSRQLDRFRRDQELYKQQAAETTDEWLEFDQELARSLKAERATFDIRRFIISLQHQWAPEALEIIKRHEAGNTHYEMTEELAAVLEKAKQNLLGSQAAVATGNEKVLEQVDRATAENLQSQVRFMQQLRASGVPPADLRMLQVQLNRSFASANFTVGGGCPGENANNFNNNPKEVDPITGEPLERPDDPEDKSKWKWKKGVCRVESCPTRPGETKIGPCNVCEKCQEKFDAGEDPTEAPEAKAETPEVADLSHFLGGSLLKESWLLPKTAELVEV